jgi:hypothetical protein
MLGQVLTEIHYDEACAIAGHIRMHSQHKVIDFPASHILALDRALPHDVEALGDSAFLLTIALPEKAK